MTDKNTGGPAFPCRIQTGGMHKCDEPPPTEIHAGMTLRDYFMAHAPEIPYTWFAPTMPTKPSELPYVSDDGQRFYIDINAAYSAEGDCFSSSNKDAINQWNSDYIKQLQIQWPAAWADEMIKERNK